ncbi:MAG TPA: glycerophosphodiester phosphodiesterase [Thermoleophilaceae bacterium]|nr:glycerophosphodiester phosphodiesterase [Thermoleophilaceae bacterium]
MNTRARWIRIVLAVLALVAIAVPAATSAAPKKRGQGKGQDAHPRAAKKPLIIGHRGASGYLPEHTLPSYKLAIEQGADYIEPDLVSTKDGVLVARHEPNIIATTNVADHPEFASRKKTVVVDGHPEEGFFVFDFTLAELKTLRAIQTRGRNDEFDGQFEIPTLQEVITLAKRSSQRLHRQIGIYPETKHPTLHQGLGLALERPLVRMLRRNGLDRKRAPVFIQSFEQANLKQLNTMTKVKLVQLVDAWDVNPDGTLQYVSPSDRPYDWEVQTPPRNDLYAHFATDAGLAEVKTYADGIGPWKPYIMPFKDQPTDLVQRAHARGLLVHTWTFRDDSFPIEYGTPIAEMRAFFDLGVDGVFTDFPSTGVTARTLWRLAN